jgi:hypothetical protein
MAKITRLRIHVGCHYARNCPDCLKARRVEHTSSVCGNALQRIRQPRYSPPICYCNCAAPGTANGITALAPEKRSLGSDAAPSLSKQGAQRDSHPFGPKPAKSLTRKPTTSKAFVQGASPVQTCASRSARVVQAASCAKRGRKPSGRQSCTLLGQASLPKSVMCAHARAHPKASQSLLPGFMGRSLACTHGEHEPTKPPPSSHPASPCLGLRSVRTVPLAACARAAALPIWTVRLHRGGAAVRGTRHGRVMHMQGTPQLRL